MSLMTLQGKRLMYPLTLNASRSNSLALLCIFDPLTAGKLKIRCTAHVRNNVVLLSPGQEWLIYIVLAVVAVD